MLRCGPSSMTAPLSTEHTETAATDAQGRASRLLAAAVMVLIVVALCRIVATYWVFNQTVDEPYQVSTGLEWWDRGTYTLDAVHGPLSRIVIALPAYLKGARLGNSGNGQYE